MIDLDKSRVDPAKLRDGTFWEIFQNQDGVLSAKRVDGPSETRGWMRVASPGVEYQRAYTRLLDQYADKVRAGTLTDEEDAAISGGALATLVRDWGNFTIDGEPLPFSHSAVLSMLTDRRWQNLRGLVDAIANDRKCLLARLDEDAMGNSQGDSSSSSGNATRPQRSGSGSE